LCIWNGNERWQARRKPTLQQRNAYWGGFGRDFWQGLPYILIIAGFVCVAWSPVREYKSISEARIREELNLIPSFSREMIEKKLSSLRESYAAPASDDPFEYYRILTRRFKTQDLFRKYQAEHEWNMNDLAIESQLNALHVGAQNDFQQKYIDKFGQPKMAGASEAYHKTHKHRMTGFLRLPRYTATYAGLWFHLMRAYLQSVLLAIVFFLVRLHRNNLRMAIETWRIIPAGFAWPYSVFVYPHRLDVRGQLRHALQFAAYLLSAFLSMGGFGGSIAKAQSKIGGGKNGDKQEYVIEADIHAELEIFPTNTEGKGTGWYLSPEILWSAENKKLGKLSGFSAIEYGDISASTGHSIGYASPWIPWLSMQSKQGWDDVVGTSWDLGVNTDVIMLPFIGRRAGKVFRYLSVGFMEEMVGDRITREVGYAWGTRKVPLFGGLAVFSEGYFNQRFVKGDCDF